jgi:hypothetical protein
LKKILLLLVAGIFTATILSCSATAALQKGDSDLVGYTLKSKKELMKQKVLNKKVKTVIVLP